MPKLYFRYGAMNSSKTANLLMVVHNYKSQGKHVITMKPSIDNRFSTDMIVSRVGISEHCDYLLDSNTSIDIILQDFIKNNNESKETISCLIVDECQFLTTEQVNDLRKYTIHFPVICYGLRTDYMSNLFSGSKRLMEIADSIEEIKTTCIYCNKKAIINAKFINGNIIYHGSSAPDIGAEEKYKSMCWHCWYSNFEINTNVDTKLSRKLSETALSHSSSYSSFSECEKQQEILNFII